MLGFDPFSAGAIAEAPLGSIPVSAVSVAAWESLMGLAVDGVAAVEWIAPVSKARGMPMEWTGRLIVAGPAAWESGQGIRSAVTSALESLASGIARSSSPAFESLQGVAEQLVAPHESRGAVIVLAAMPMESLATRRGSSTAALESTAQARESAALSWESLGRVASARTMPAEWKGLLQVLRAAGWESLGSVSAEATAALEWTARAHGIQAIPIEWLAEVAMGRTLPWESIRRHINRVIAACFKSGPRVTGTYASGPRILGEVTSGVRIVATMSSAPRITADPATSAPRLSGEATSAPRITGTAADDTHLCED